MEFVGNYKQIIQTLLESEPNLEKKYVLKDYREKRSLTQNAYAWVLIGKIADCLTLSKEVVYFDMLKHYGQSQVVSVRADCPVNGYFKYFEEMGKGTVNGVIFNHYRVFMGSSEYDSKQMSVFIDGIIEEAKNLGIQTLSTEYLKGLKLI